MRFRTGLGTCAAALALAAAPTAHAADFLAGAAKQVTSPPLAGTPAGNAADASFAPLFSTVCAGFPNRGRFALQEPFVHQHGNVLGGNREPLALEPALGREVGGGGQKHRLTVETVFFQ